MNEIIEQINIEDMIYEIRGKQVMLDSDLAKLYNVETKRINEAITRNIDKFPTRFAFRISEKEYNSLKSQIATSKGGSRKGHTVFTEQGATMLATILKSKTAIQTSIKIIDAFVTMRKFINNNFLEMKSIQEMLINHDNKLNYIDNEMKSLQSSYDELVNKRKLNRIYFNGQFYDAYSNIIDIFDNCKNELIIIDSYADKYTLDLISKLKVNVILITTKKLLKQIDITNYNKQYHNLTIKYNNTFHDRYFILDRSIIYHCGTSLNHMDNKTFSINILNDINVKKSILDKIDQII